MDFQLPIFGFPPVLSLQITTIAGLLTLASAVVHVMFAIGVHADGQRRIAGRQRVLFGPPWMWGLGVLVMGLPLIAFYWLVHHSQWVAAANVPQSGGAVAPAPPVAVPEPPAMD